MGPGRLHVFMPGSLAAASAAIERSFAAIAPGAELAFRTAPTGLIASEIVAGAPADVFISANGRYMEAVRTAGLAVRPRVLAGNRLCIVVDAGGGVAVEDVRDLARPGLRVVTPPAATDPCGEYVAALFARAGTADAMAAKEAAGELFHSSGSADLPGYVTRGAADAGVLYRSEAARLRGVVTVELPAALDMRDAIAFFIAPVCRGEPSARVMRFVDHMTGPDGQALLVEEGFLPARAAGTTP